MNSFAWSEAEDDIDFSTDDSDQHSDFDFSASLRNDELEIDVFTLDLVSSR